MLGLFNQGVSGVDQEGAEEEEDPGEFANDY